MEESSSCEISRDNIVYTLMKVSQLDSTSSSSLDQSTSTINKAIDCGESCSKISNINAQSHIHPTKHPIINPAISIKSNLAEKMDEKLLQLYWTNYIHWKTLLTFGFALWIALCIADKSPQHFSSLDVSESSNVVEIKHDTNDEEGITQQTVNDSYLKWFYDLTSYISWTNRLPDTTQACILSLLMVIIIFIEFRLRNRSTKHKPQGLCNQCHNDFQRAKLCDDKYHDKLAMERLKNEKGMNIYDELGPVSSENNPHAVKIIPYDEMSVDSDLFWELEIIDSRDHHHINDNIKRNDNKHFSKLGIHSNVTTNIDRLTWNNDNYVNNKYNWRLNSKNFCTHNCNCSSPYNYNPFESINVNPTYDTEINKYIMSKCNTSTTAFEEITGDLWKFKSNDIGRRKNQNNDSNDDNDELSSLSTIKNNKNNNNRIISSSPAFKKFLSGLKNNPTAFNTQSWIYN